MIQGDVDVLAVRFDEELHEEKAKGVSSVPDRSKTGDFQEAAAYPL